MKEFTFIVLTYNQEKYIIEHLESIKHQIIKFGGNYQNYIVICDDNSTDNTVEYAEKWLDYNKQYIYDFKIIKQSVNKGIVNNYLAGIKGMNTDMFSLVAGDDLYFDNSVYDAAEKSNFVYTPRISFDSLGNIHREKLWLFKQCMITKKTVHYEMKKWMKYRMVIDIMSVKWRKSFCTPELIKKVGRYKWVEDYPSMDTVLNDARIDSALYMKPIILYRDDSGISNRKSHNKKTEYDMEQERLFKDYKLKLTSAPKYINVYNYYFVIHKFLFLIKCKFVRKIVEFEKEYDNECYRAIEYLDMIKKNAKIFKKEFEILKCN